MYMHIAHNTQDREAKHTVGREREGGREGGREREREGEGERKEEAEEEEVSRGRPHG